MTDEKKLVLVDGSGYLFRAFYAVPSLTAPDGRPTGVIYAVVNMLRLLLKEEEPDYFLVAFDAKGRTFRHQMYPDYKANRPPTPPDLQAQIQPLFHLIEKLGYRMLQVEGFEADDVIATVAVAAAAKGYLVTIATGDKDFAQIVTDRITLFDPMKKLFLDSTAVKKKLGVFPGQVVDFLALMGDKSDNIPGVDGVGQKTAVRWLEKYSTLERLLQHSEEIRGKAGENLRSSREAVLLYQQLASINCAVPLDIEVEDLRRGMPDLPALRNIYTELNFRTLLHEVENLPNEKRDSTLCLGDADPQLVLRDDLFQEWLKRLQTAAVFAFDVETAGEDYMQAEIVGVAFATDTDTAAYVPVAHDYADAPVQLPRDKVLAALRSLLQDENIKKAGYHLQYARNVLSRYDINLRGIEYDTMLQSCTLNSAGDHGFAALCLEYLSWAAPPLTALAGKGSKRQPLSRVDVAATCRYFAGKVQACMRLHQLLYAKLRRYTQALEFYRETELPLLRVLSDIEQKGVCLDTTALAEQDACLSSRIRHVKKQIYAESGHEFNLDSPVQMRQVLFSEHGLPVLKKTRKGEASTDEEVLHQLADGYILPRLILQYRLLSKLQSTYTQKLPQAVNPKTQRIHTSYHQAGTATGRLSSSHPNLQNIPIRTVEGKRIRKAFVSADGYLQVVADYSQIELRLMAHFSRDENLCAAFHHGEDVHKLTAAEVFGTPVNQVTELERRSAKAINFGLIYGMQAFGLARQLGISRGQAQVYLETYFERYPGVRQYMSDVKRLARQKGYVETLFGRRLYLPELRSRHAATRRYVERSAINAPMQGSAADIIKRAMVGLHRQFDVMQIDAAIIMQVHDELVIEARESEVDRVAAECRRIMSAAADLTVPLEVDIGIGANWSAAH